VVQSTRFEFLINLKTAKTLGIEVPPSLSAEADKFIRATCNVGFWPEAAVRPAPSNVWYRGMNGLVFDKPLGRKLSVAEAGFLRAAFHISLRG
jgi:hypothetical protein